MMKSPPVGIHKEMSGCLPSCFTFEYVLVEEETSIYDMDMRAVDLRCTSLT